MATEVQQLVKDMKRSICIIGERADAHEIEIIDLFGGEIMESEDADEKRRLQLLHKAIQAAAEYYTFIETMDIA